MFMSKWHIVVLIISLDNFFRIEYELKLCDNLYTCILSYHFPHTKTNIFREEGGSITFHPNLPIGLFVFLKRAYCEHVHNLFKLLNWKCWRHLWNTWCWTIINSHVPKAFIMISFAISQDLQALGQIPIDKQMWMVQHIKTSDSHMSEVHSKATL